MREVVALSHELRFFGIAEPRAISGSNPSLVGLVPVLVVVAKPVDQNPWHLVPADNSRNTVNCIEVIRRYLPTALMWDKTEQ